MTLKTFLLSGFVATALCATTAVADELVMPNQEPASDGRWFFSPGIGWVNFEGDEPLKDGFYVALRLGYDINQWWSVEGGLAYAPSLDENFERPWQYNFEKEVSRSKGSNHDFGDTWMTQTFVDFLFHMSTWDKMDPYLAFGAGVDLYGVDCFNNKAAAVLRVGGGFFYHISDSWALRVDTRIHLDSDNTEFHHFLDVGFRFTFGGAGLVDDPAGPTNVADLDSDGDGLTDRYELEIGTDPNNPDTDGDGLTDGEEVLTYGTDPLNKDSDYDWLTDGAEVRTYGTNPLDPDTDKGGVKDGHEVIVDKTDPRPGHGDDDVMLIRLNVQFDTDKSIIKDSFDEDLQKVVKVLLRNPSAKAVIEGHADKRDTSNRKHNQQLSENRAKAIQMYFTENGVDASRLSAKGYGFDRPIAPNDPKNGNIVNRRVEVFISGIQDKKVQYVNP